MDIRPLVEAIRSLNAEDAFRARLGAEQWQTFASYLSRHEIRAGDRLIRQGDHDRTLYLLELGSLQVYRERAAPGAQRIAILRAGSVVGEAGLLGDTPRTAHVDAMAPCTVWALRPQRLEELSAHLPALALEVVRAAAAVLARRFYAHTLDQLPVG